MYYTKQPSERQLRVGELIREGVARILVSGSTDLGSIMDEMIIAVSYVKMAPDIKLATIYITIYSTRPADQTEGHMVPESTQKLVIDALNAQAKEIRRQLASLIQMRHIPEIRFIFDKINEEQKKLDNLFRKITMKKDPNPK